jgi:hypothetical protein
MLHYNFYFWRLHPVASVITIFLASVNRNCTFRIKTFGKYSWRNPKRSFTIIVYCKFSSYLLSAQPGVRCLRSCCCMTMVVRWLMLALPKGPNRGGVSISSPEGGNRSSFRRVVFSSLFEFRTIDKVLKPSNSEYYTPSSETFRFY